MIVNIALPTREFFQAQYAKETATAINAEGRVSQKFAVINFAGPNRRVKTELFFTAFELVPFSESNPKCIMQTRIMKS